jgi:hypothetical protein
MDEMTKKLRSATKVVQELVHGSVWEVISRQLKGANQVDAALAYVTVAPSFLTSGSRLACDLSLRAVRQKSSDPRVALKLMKKGVEIYSHEGLHAKVIATSSVSIVGSANASNRSGLTGRARLIEAVCINTGPKMVNAARRFIDSLSVESARIFPQEARKLVPHYGKDAPKGPPPKSGGTRTEKKNTRVWRLRYVGNRKWTAEEKAAVKASEHGARKYVQDNMTARFLEWPLSEDGGISTRDARQIRAGDKVLSIVTSGRNLEVWPLATVVGRTHVLKDKSTVLLTIRPPGRKPIRPKVSTLKEAGVLSLMRSHPTRQLKITELQRVDGLFA